MPGTKWNAKYVWQAYQHAANGYGLGELAEAFGVIGATLRNWGKKHPELREAYNAGRKVWEEKQKAEKAIIKKASPTDTFHDYLYRQLTPELQETWDIIQNTDLNDGPGMARVEAMLAEGGQHIRKRIFLHAWSTSNFQLGKALRRSCVSKRQFEVWCHDSEFASLVEEIQWHKDNYFEDALIRLVMEGNTKAILHVAKSKLASRGYNPTTQINAQVDTNNADGGLDIDKLDLPVEVRLAIVEAMRAAKEAEAKTIEGTVV